MWTEDKLNQIGILMNFTAGILLAPQILGTRNIKAVEQKIAGAMSGMKSRFQKGQSVLKLRFIVPLYDQLVQMSMYPVGSPPSPPVAREEDQSGGANESPKPWYMGLDSLIRPTLELFEAMFLVLIAPMITGAVLMSRMVWGLLWPEHISHWYWAALATIAIIWIGLSLALALASLFAAAIGAALGHIGFGSVLYTTSMIFVAGALVILVWPLAILRFFHSIAYLVLLIADLPPTLGLWALGKRELLIYMTAIGFGLFVLGNGFQFAATLAEEETEASAPQTDSLQMREHAEQLLRSSETGAPEPVKVAPSPMRQRKPTQR